jgi:hypothetical protein
MDDKEIPEKEKGERKSPIQKTKKIVLPKEQARIEWRKYVNLLKTRKDKHLRIMREAMYYAKKGKELIDVFEVMKAGKLNSNNEPRLAIARASLNTVYFQKQDEGRGTFGGKLYYDRSIEYHKTNITFLDKTFNIHWERTIDANGKLTWEIKDKILKTKVPMIPAELMPEGDLENYYILWEVKEWEKLPEPKDPFLLKRISENLFVILGKWEITELERAVIGGL